MTNLQIHMALEKMPPKARGIRAQDCLFINSIANMRNCLSQPQQEARGAQSNAVCQALMTEHRRPKPTYRSRCNC
ncbi:MAG: hypothetical protein NZ602_13155 [Thermoguttaceae bacterium]|nr:hypothetical protein [Thermoguttaceae bacterium]MDW8036785.1 hypothetical protein [Thermoguttaceae bacterium]